MSIFSLAVIEMGEASVGTHAGGAAVCFLSLADAEGEGKTSSNHLRTDHSARRESRNSSGC